MQRQLDGFARLPAVYDLHARDFDVEIPMLQRIVGKLVANDRDPIVEKIEIVSFFVVEQCFGNGRVDTV